MSVQADGVPTRERIRGALSYLGPASIIVCMYARSKFVAGHGRQGLSVFVLQAVGCLIIGLFLSSRSPWAYGGLSFFLVITVGLQVWLAASAALGKTINIGFIPKY